uniref:AIRS_C domain-containing protein n=1 Tax=Heterorhabditis bacteriophora TaxID=37862 RepID=A0A1I7X4E0_HETBA
MIADRIQSRAPVLSVHVIVQQPSFGALNGVDGGIIILESESSDWKTVEIQD